MIVGVDVGQRRDPTALAVLDGWDVRHLERLPLGTSYMMGVERIATVAAAGMRIVVDATGIGRAVVELLEARGLLPLAVTLTGGKLVRVEGSRVSLPRSALFVPLVAAVEAGRLRVAAGLSFGPELLQELRTARERGIGRQVEARGAGHHGDLMPAVALAVWGQSPQLA